MAEINGELMRIPNTLLPKLKQDLMLPQDKDLTVEEKVYSRILRPAYSFIIPFSSAFSIIIAESIVPSPSLDQVHPNSHLTLPVLLRHPSWHRRTFGTTTPRPSNNGQSGTARPLARRRVLLQSDRDLLRVAVITRTPLVRPRTNLRWRPWLLSILRREVARPDHRTCRMA